MALFPLVLQRLGRRIKELRKERGWSQEKLADKAEISRTYMGTIELGAKQPRLGTLFRIAKALNIPLAEVFLPASADQPQGAEIVARIHARLLERGRTLPELHKIDALIDAYLRKGR